MEAQRKLKILFQKAANIEAQQANTRESHKDEELMNDKVRILRSDDYSGSRVQDGFGVGEIRGEEDQLEGHHHSGSGSG